MHCCAVVTCRVSVRDYEAMIQAVSGKQIAEFTRRLLSSKPSLAAFGDGTDALNYDNLVKRFDEGNWGQRSSNPMGLEGPDGQLVHGVFERLKKGLSMSGGRSSYSSSSSGDSSRSSSRDGSSSSSRSNGSSSSSREGSREGSSSSREGSSESSS